MKILQVCDYYQPLGGAEQYLLSVSQALEGSGHQISVLFGIQTQHTFASPARTELHLPILVEEKPLARADEHKLDEFIAEENPDIVFIHNVKNPVVIRHLSQKKPTARFVHDFSLTCLNWRKILPRIDRICPFPFGFRCLFNTYANRCASRNPMTAFQKLRSHRYQLESNRNLDVLIVASQYMKSVLIQNGFPPDRVEVIPYYTEPIPFDRIEFLNFILFVGRLHETKGLQDLLGALVECPENLKLIVVGEGYYRGEIDRIIAQKNLAGRIEFSGWLPQERLREHYLSCLALVVPSLWPEPFGIVGIEAMSYGKPVIGYNVGGIPDWLQNNVNGFLVERKNVAGLAEKITFLHDHSETSRIMGKAGRDLHKKSYTQERHLASLLECFEGLIR